MPSSMKTHISCSLIFSLMNALVLYIFIFYTLYTQFYRITYTYSILLTSLFFFRWSIWSCNQLIQDMLNRNPIYISQLHLQDINLWNSISMIHFVLYVNSGQKHQCRFTMAGKLASAVEHFSGMYIYNVKHILMILSIFSLFSGEHIKKQKHLSLFVNEWILVK